MFNVTCTQHCFVEGVMARCIYAIPLIVLGVRLVWSSYDIVLWMERGYSFVQVCDTSDCAEGQTSLVQL